MEGGGAALAAKLTSMEDGRARERMKTRTTELASDIGAPAPIAGKQ